MVLSHCRGVQYGYIQSFVLPGISDSGVQSNRKECFVEKLIFMKKLTIRVIIYFSNFVVERFVIFVIIYIYIYIDNGRIFSK